MARLPVYINQTGLDTGADTFKLAPDTGAAIAKGVTTFGDAIMGTAERGMKEAKQVSLKAEAYAERDAALRDEVEFIRLGDRIQQRALDLQDKVGDDAAGYTREVEKLATDEYSNLLASGRLSSTNRSRHDLMFERMRNGIADRAATYEATTKQKFRSEVYEATAKNITAFVIANGVGGLDQAQKEWSEFVTRTEGGIDTRLGKKMFELGMRRFEQQAFKAEAIRRGPAFLGQFQGLFSENPSATSGNAQVDATLKYAPINGIDPRVGVAIGWIESRLNMNHGKPIGRDGRPMSSAEGGWQILDGVARDFKLTPEEKRDPEKATAAVMAHFAQNKALIEKKGITATPGKIYMYWNVGQGVADRILKADPNTPIEQIIYSAYPSRPGLAATVLRNNPSMYRAGMTAGDVIQNYEVQMARAQTATAKYFSEKVQTDEQTSAAVSAFMGRDMPRVGTADLMETYADVARTTKEASAKARDLAAGEAHLANPGVGDPYDSQRKKEVNAAVEARVGDSLVTGLGTGDIAAIVTARQYTDAAGFIPDKVMHGFRAAIDANTMTSTRPALQALADLSRTNPVAYRASSLHNTEKDMVHDYRAFTETLGLDPVAATKYIIETRTPEGKKRRQAMADKTRAEWRNGGTEADAEATAWGEITKGFDQSVWSDPDVANDTQRESIVEAYRMGIVRERLNGYDATEAKARALQTLKGVWGVSSVADSSRSQALMPLAPEKVFAGKAIRGSFDWIKEQATNTLDRWLVETGRASLTRSVAISGGRIVELKDEQGKTHTPFKLIPSEGAMNDYLSGREVSYDIWYQDKDGRIQKAVGRPFTPNFADAKAKDDEDFRKQREERDAARRKPAIVVNDTLMTP